MKLKETYTFYQKNKTGLVEIVKGLKELKER